MSIVPAGKRRYGVDKFSCVIMNSYRPPASPRSTNRSARGRAMRKEFDGRGFDQHGARAIDDCRLQRVFDVIGRRLPIGSGETDAARSIARREQVAIELYSNTVTFGGAQCRGRLDAHVEGAGI